jgi:hypothetical protein
MVIFQLGMFNNKSHKGSINLLNNIEEPRDSSELFYTWVVNYGRYILIGVEIIVIIVFVSKILVDQEYNYAISTSYSMQSKFKSKSLQNKVNLITSYQNKMSTIVGLSQVRFNYEYTLNKILTLIPKGISVQSIDIQYNNFNIVGVSNNYNSLQKLLDKFKSDSKDFSKVYLPSLSNSVNLNQTNNVSFSLSGNINLKH